MTAHSERRSFESSHRGVDLGLGGVAVAPGDHVAHFYRTRQEAGDVVVAFLQQGLQTGDRCVYVVNEDAVRRDVLATLSARGADSEGALRTGQLTCYPGAERAEDMRDALVAALADIPSRFRLLRWVGEMTWALEKMPTAEALMEWEAACNVADDRAHAVFLCQYELARFPGGVVADALSTHPLCIFGGTVHRNPYYEEPAVFLDRLRRRASEPLRP